MNIKIKININIFNNKKTNNYHKHSEDLTKSNNHLSSKKGAYGLVVMTSPSHGGGRRFKSG